MKNKTLIFKTLTRFISVFALSAGVILLNSCGNPRPGKNKTGNELDSLKGLKDYYKDFFPIGVAVAPGSVEGEQSTLILKHFNSLTTENVLKPGPIHPEENRYFWDNADKIVNFAQANGLKVRGHTLCWHNQT